jgi:mono/diheme cytochrome c family protein
MRHDRRLGRPTWSVVVVVVALGALGCSEPPLPEAGEWTAADHTQPDRGAATTNQQRAPRAERASDPLAAAAALWNVTCASCHGRTGAGDGPAAPGPMVSFASAEWQNGRSDVEIAQVITDGRNMMPAFGDTIAPAGIEALVALIRRFGGATGPAPAGAPGPTVGGAPGSEAPAAPGASSPDPSTPSPAGAPSAPPAPSP